jgi:hypothetical protein
MSNTVIIQRTKMTAESEAKRFMITFCPAPILLILEVIALGVNLLKTYSYTNTPPTPFFPTLLSSFSFLFSAENTIIISLLLIGSAIIFRKEEKVTTNYHEQKT